MKSPIHSTIPVNSSLPESAQPGSMMLTVSGALIAVLLLIVAVAWLARRFGLAAVAPKHNKLMTLKGSLSLGPRERVVVVEVANRWLVVGVSPAGLTPLSSLEKPEAATIPAAQGDFHSLFKTCLTAAKREKK